jgi:hypothetical protein
VISKDSGLYFSAKFFLEHGVRKVQPANAGCTTGRIIRESGKIKRICPRIDEMLVLTEACRVLLGRNPPVPSSGDRMQLKSRPNM